MTIGIATICEAKTGNPKIVFCADRLVTNEQGLTFEQGKPKIVAITNNCLIIGAGSSVYADRILQNTMNRMFLEQKKLRIEDIAVVLKEEHQKIRTEAINDQILKPRGLDLEKFYSNIKNFPEWLGILIDSEIRNYNFDVEFLIFGLDIYNENERKFAVAHVYQIIENGELYCFDSTGFAMIGIGSGQSLPEITKEPYGPDNSLSDATVRTFWAKKSAERMISVGKTTDLGIIGVDIDKETGMLIPRNAIADYNFINLLEEGFETHIKTLKKLSVDIKDDVNKVIFGERAISPKHTTS